METEYLEEYFKKFSEEIFKSTWQDEKSVLYLKCGWEMRELRRGHLTTFRVWVKSVKNGVRGFESRLPLQFLSSLKDDKQIKIPFSRKAFNEYSMALK